ncbi:S8 family serine peptidase [Shewanella goraebulensis]|uniref:S8 family serine peptidase n=1 Tax=Shewanella goraebulensis TaxID=3050637 RepID=UPI00254AB72D|nr:S8 family serine peptidase [Shewanella goraebulensis]
MQLKKISLMTIAAIYAAGAGSVAASGSPEPEFRSIEITDAIIKFNEDLNNGKDRAGNSLNRPNSNGKNVHRAIATNTNSKVPFKYQAGLQGEHTYIVELSDKPVSLYRGGNAQYAATSPSMSTVPAMLNARGYNKLNLQSSAVKSYSQYLTSKQDQVLSQISGTVGGQLDVKNRYTLAFNGMALRMTQAQAANVAELPGVRNVSIEKQYELHTDNGPEHIGADGLWTGSAADDKYKGEGIVIGVLDTGINSDHPSFAATAGDGYVHTMPARYDGYLGDCEKAEFADMCNDKLIGIRSYESITDSYMDPLFQPDEPSWNITNPKRPQNGEDYNGHGSHTASTSAGNELFNVNHVVGAPGETGDGVPTGLEFAKVSGVAPRANIIMYQVCFPGDGSFGDGYGGCPGSALLAGIEDAVADGVDVINYSIGTTYGSFPWDDPMELGFLAAREAGISVSASAGNSYDPVYASQARGAIDHFSPWLTSVAATTHSREIAVEGKALTDATGGEQDLELVGGGITGAYTGPVVEAKAYGSEFEKCNDPFPADFFSVDPDGNPYSVAPIVVCKRGDIPRVTKATNIEAGGAGGLILWNSGYSETTANDPFSIPGIHIDYNSYYGSYDNGYYGLQDWLSSGADHMITITASEVVSKERTPDYVADFSSRGPNFEAPDVMSPSLAAPGVDVYAAWADDMAFSTQGMPADWAAISGTSMAAPHVAGAMALLSQAHPDWTPAQIQSALMMTASIDNVTRARDASPYDPVPGGYSDAGSGVINVSRANNAGLLMDETAENYRAANPSNGGNIHTLNLPYFYQDNCAGTCSWMRIVTATEDGTWTVDAEAMEIDGAPMLELEVSPKSFSLKAGESQAISLKAKVLEVEAIGADSSSLQLTGSVKLTPADTSTPMQHLPVGVRYSGDNLPSEVSGIIHRTQGHTLTPMLNTAEIQSLNSKVFGLTKGEKFTFNLPLANARLYSDGLTVEEIEADGGAKVTFFDVPEGTKRVVWEVLSAPKHAYTSIDLGMDINNDGEIQWLDEAICYSYTDNGDFCAINNPTPGRYWAIAANWKYDYEDPKNQADEFIVSLGVVTENDDANLTVEGPATTDGLTPYQLTLNYNLPDVMEGETYYGVVGLGSDDYNETNLGDFAVKLQHMGTDTVIESSQTAAKVGDVVDFVVELAPNLLGAEREFTMTANLSEGMQLIEDSVVVGGVGNYEEGLLIEGNNISINSAQPSSSDMQRHYVFTTNLDDAMCKVPYGDDETFYDLPMQGYQDLGISGLSNQVFYIPMAESGLPYIPLYANPEVFSQNVLGISPFGYIQLDTNPEFWNFNQPFTDQFQTFPDTIIAPLWRGDVSMPQGTIDWETFRYKNVVYGITTPDHYIFQWDGGEEWNSFLVGNSNPDPDAKFNIQTIISTDISFDPGTPEMIFAYQTLKSANDHFGSIGLHGYWGERGAFGPSFGYLNDGFAYNDVDEKVSEGTVVCADYRGPEQTAVSLKFSARVSATSIGSDNMLAVETQYADSELVSVSQTISTPSNITVAAMADMTMEENTILEGLSVMYNDVKGTANGMMVSGENITAEITGETFSITPDADWHGTTEVTVTVHDMAYPSDSASTSFMLTVNSDGVDPAPVPPAAEEAPEEADSSDGGSMGILSLILVGLLGASRRRKLH